MLSDIVREELVETKDFIERSVWIRDDGVWFYQKGIICSVRPHLDASYTCVYARIGDPDFEPKNIRVDGGPLRDPPRGGRGKAKARPDKQRVPALSRR